METRSRKRAEATSTAHPSSSPSPTTRSGKRFRKTQSSSTSASIPTRTRVTRAHPSLMDPFTPVESTSSSSRSRRNRNNNNESSSSDKGKAKEHEVRARDRDNQTLKLDIENYDNNPNEDDDDDSEGGIGAFHPNLTSASSALQGLLRKLGAGFDDLLPGSGIPSSSSSLQHLSGRMKKILSGLQADGEEGKQVEALTQLCDILSIGTEESLSSFSVDVFVPVLVGLLSYERNADIMLLAARAITHLCEVLPSSCGVVVHYGAIPCLVSRLVNIEYMDVFEQSLQALTKISLEHPTACLRAGALTAVLSYLDFFSIEVQRVALSTAANMCKKIPSDAAHFAMDAVPSLTSRLQYHDTRVLEHASVCLTRIAEAFASCPDQLDALCNHGVVTEAASLISSSNSGGGQTSLSPPIYTGLIRLLSTCASGSPLGTKTLLHLGISGILKDILSGSSVSANITVSPALSRPAEQMFEIVNLANELLPPLPPETISIPAGSNNLVKGPIVKKPSSANSGKQFADGNDLEVSAREKLLKDHPELLEQFGIDLLPVMIQMYGSSVNSSVRHKCLSVIGKLMYFSSAEMIQSLINVTNISSFLAGVLAWKDPQVLVPALQIAEILMEKLPTTFSKVFVREGVLHAIDQLAMSGNSNTKSIQPSHSEKDNDSSSVSSRSRRYKRRGDSTNKEGSSFEESTNPILGNIGSPPSSIEIPMLHSNLRMHVSACAKAFKDKYFPSAAEVGVTEDLLHLKNLCAKLNAGVNDQKTIAKGKSKASGSRILDCSAVSEECLIGIISEILTELGKGDGVSTFEFVGSGVVSALLNYLSCGFFSREKILEANLPKLREQALKRYKMFVSLALPSIDEKSATPMTILVQKLQNALTSLERFPVVLSQSSRSSSGIARLSSGLGALAQTCKLRLCRAQGEKSLRDYSSNVVLIDPLASLAAVEQFLWPRIQRGDSGKKSAVPAGNSETPAVPGGSASSTSIPSSHTRRHSSRSRSSLDVGDASRKEPLLEKNASLSKGKGKAVLKAALEEAKGPQTRNATRRRAALDKDEQVKPENGDSSSEDDELDVSHVELDDAMVIEDDDISEDDNDDNDDDDDDHEDVLRDDSLPVCTPDKVHDVKLGNTSEDNSDAPATDDNQTNLASGSSSRAAAVRGSDSSEFRFGSSYGSRGALSFAAAAMAGLGSANGRGIRGDRDRQGRSPFGSSNDPPKLIFSVGGKPLYRNLTIYQAVQKQLMEEEDDDQFTGDFVSSDGSRLWNDICTITYRRADTQSDGATAGATSSTTSKSKKSSSSSNSDSQPHQLSLLDSILQGELPCDLEKSNPTYNILALLRVLEGLNQLAPRLREQVAFDNFVEGNTSYLDDLNSFRVKVSAEDFINNKLTPKLARQVQDALALCSGSVPSWCFQLTKACPFLFPFETRRQYFYSTAFGLSRALYRLQQQQGADGHASNNERELRVGRLQRQKVRVSRNRILDSALKVMEMYSSQKAVLEVEYFGEVGTGLGPTLEFYTLLSRDLQKLSLGLWRSNASFERASMDIDDEGKDGVSIDADLVQAPLGLFPRPWHPNADASGGSQYFKVIEYFRLLGRVMAKALQDGRLLDLPLSMAFYKLVLGQELDLFDILSFDMELGKVLQELHAIVLRKHYLESRGNDKNDAIADLRFRGASIEDLCFDFSLPGYPEYILKPGNETVDINNLEEYISLVVDATVKSGFVRQMEAFRAGFNQVFDISSLQIFSPQELDYLLCGRRELWEPQTLVDYIKFDHGYTAKSPAIVNLLEIMGEFTPEQQQAFCQFVTGAPRLPPGGLAVLNPRLTIVRKHSAAGNASLNGSGGVSECADEDLPSVMTCANYLKLPPYSTKEIMYKKLLFAINEGQGSFDLS